MPPLPLEITSKEFSHLQTTCPTWSDIRNMIGEEVSFQARLDYKYEEIDGLLYRTCVKGKWKEKKGMCSLIVLSD